jgi:integrative and conjugative element protein (TIGR02256 family)
MKVWIETRVTQALAQAASDSAPAEVGGVLGGWLDGNDPVICFATVGGENAVATPTSYDPDHAWQEQELLRVFTASHGDLSYLGDWHSHPSGPLALSSKDQKTLRAIATARSRNCMLLCANVGNSWALAGWYVGKSLGLRLIHPASLRSFDAPTDWPVLVSYARRTEGVRVSTR